MNNVGWMPKNPCNPKCDLPDDQCDVCAWHIQKYEYNLKVSAQKNLLEHLVVNPDKGEWTEFSKQDCIKIRTLKSMLKELEENK